jgi:hypothetical protein
VRIWLAPVRYYQITHSGKLMRDWIAPSLVAAVTAVLVLINLKTIKIFERGLIDDFNPMLAMLAGLYIAALTAVASLPNRNLDRLIQGDTPTIPVLERGTIYQVELTRRRYLSLLFGFLAYLCIFAYLVGIVAKHTAPLLSPLIPADVATWVNFGGLFGYFFLIASILIHSIVGIHYLQERIHRASSKPDAQRADDKSGS